MMKRQLVGRSRPGPRRSRMLVPRMSELEGRVLLAAPTINPIPAATVPAGKTLFVPITATDPAGIPLTYSVASTNPQITAKFIPGTFLKLSVQGFGDLTFQLFDTLTPNTVAQISDLVRKGFYNGLTFHRVVPNFVIQGGDPKGDGTGGPGFEFDDEFNPNAIFSGNGQLALANSGKDTNGSQFFVTLGPQRFLDFNYTLLGQLIRGFDVLSKIDAIPNSGAPDNRPLTPPVITSAALVSDPSDGLLELTAAPTAAGASASINVTATLPDGATTAGAFQATAAADTANDPPILGPVSNQATPANTPVTFTLSSTDLENDPPHFDAAVTDTVANATISVSGNAITVTPTAGFTGIVHVIVGVQESSGRFDTQNITVAVGIPALLAQGTPFAANAHRVSALAPVVTFTPTTPEPLSAYTAAIDWGDGTTSTGTVTPGSGSSFVVNGSHTYTGPGLFVVTTTINDSVTAATTTASTTATVTQTPTRPPGDYFGNGRTDLGLFDQTTSTLSVIPPAGAVGLKPLIQQFGDPSHRNIPVVGDHTGDGKADLGIYDATAATFFIIKSDGSGPLIQQLGNPSHVNVPVSGDYYGDGKADLGLFDQTTATLDVIPDAPGLKPLIQQFGDPSHRNIPVSGDYDGDGKADLGVYDATAATFFIIPSNGGKPIIQQLGDATHRNVPVSGDYYGDGKTDLGLFDQTTSTLFVIPDAPGQSPLIQQFGDPSHRNIPVVGDHTGDGKADLGIYDATAATFFIIKSDGSGPLIQQLGDPSHANVPVPSTAISSGLQGMSLASDASAPLAVVLLPADLSPTPTPTLPRRRPPQPTL